MSSHHPFPRHQDAQDYRAQGDRSIGQDLDNIFRLTAAQFPPAQQSGERGRTAAPEPRRVTQPDLDAALDMLNRAAKARLLAAVWPGALSSNNQSGWPAR